MRIAYQERLFYCWCIGPLWRKRKHLQSIMIDIKLLTINRVFSAQQISLENVIVSLKLELVPPNPRSANRRRVGLAARPAAFPPFERFRAPGRRSRCRAAGLGAATSCSLRIASSCRILVRFRCLDPASCRWRLDSPSTHPVASRCAVFVVQLVRYWWARAPSRWLGDCTSPFASPVSNRRKNLRLLGTSDCCTRSRCGWLEPSVLRAPAGSRLSLWCGVWARWGPPGRFPDRVFSPGTGTAAVALSRPVADRNPRLASFERGRGTFRTEICPLWSWGSGRGRAVGRWLPLPPWFGGGWARVRSRRCCSPGVWCSLGLGRIRVGSVLGRWFLERELISLLNRIMFGKQIQFLAIFFFTIEKI